MGCQIQGVPEHGRDGSWSTQVLWTGVCWDEVGGETRKRQRHGRQRAAGLSQNNAKGQTRGCVGEVVGRWMVPAPFPLPQPRVSSFCYFRASCFPELSGFPARWGQGRRLWGWPCLYVMGLTFTFSQGDFFFLLLVKLLGKRCRKQWAGNQGWGLPSQSLQLCPWSVCKYLQV